MKVIDIMIKPTYSCNVCHKWFKSKEEFKAQDFLEHLDFGIILLSHYLVICSRGCMFKFIYRLIQKQDYTIDNLKQLLKCIEKDKEIEYKSSHFAIYEITKHYQEIGLSNIKHLGSRLKALAQGSKNGIQGSRLIQFPPYRRGNEPEPEPTILKAHNSNLTLSNFGGIK